ncbi:MAG TPA: UDP-glucose/GDP-mannose dehydrogenase family protein [Coriobacteriia bacterium]|nr:UDP-glucose/GDP-mannose dehydrogenase family protein [Coriobacteriia bacterium]
MQSRTVTVFGAGYVGLVAGACLASSGHRVTVLDVDKSKLESLRGGRTPFHEPGLDDVLSKGIESGALTFSHPSELGEYGEYVFIAVGTPSTSTGSSDLRYVSSVIEQIIENVPADSVVVMKSTVPPGTGQMLAKRLQPKGIHYVSNPEFLREGSAVHDWFKTDRMVLGGEPEAAARVAKLYEDIDAPILSCNISSAELVKYASNAFLAMKISFANEIANLCDKVDADITMVMEGVGMDPRIGGSFLNAGIGYGGSCFPKDTRALDYLYSINGHYSQLLKAVIDVNAFQRRLPVTALKHRLGDLLGLKIAVLGLSFKPNTDDTREAPAGDIIRMLLVEGAEVRGYDPVGVLPFDSDLYTQQETIEQAVAGASAVVIATEWDQIVSADWKTLAESMVGPRIVFDGRNCVNPADVRAGGAEYVGVGCR